MGLEASGSSEVVYLRCSLPPFMCGSLEALSQAGLGGSVAAALTGVRRCMYLYYKHVDGIRRQIQRLWVFLRSITPQERLTLWFS